MTEGSCNNGWKKVLQAYIRIDWYLLSTFASTRAKLTLVQHWKLTLSITSEICDVFVWLNMWFAELLYGGAFRERRKTQLDKILYIGWLLFNVDLVSSPIAVPCTRVKYGKRWKITQKSIHIIIYLFMAISTLFPRRFFPSSNEIMIISSRRFETEFSGFVQLYKRIRRKLRFKWIYDCDVRLLDPLTTETNKKRWRKKWVRRRKRVE